MKRRGLLAGLGCAVIWPSAAHSQQPASAARIGWITAQQAASLTPYVDAFRASLEDLGLVEGRNLVIVFRYGNDAIFHNQGRDLFHHLVYHRPDHLQNIVKTGYRP